ncbi:recombinase family protein [Ancylobacter sp.]|uniref:recombinase family protein n=1 Tax=Ancylobacter sp. TaxID=1872567 RepID=UPI003C7E591D
MSGARADRRILASAIKRLEPGDVLLVTRLDRLARPTRDARRAPLLQSVFFLLPLVGPMIPLGQCCWRLRATYGWLVERRAYSAGVHCAANGAVTVLLR